jgi:hypothetical protein
MKVACYFEEYPMFKAGERDSLFVVPKDSATLPGVVHCQFQRIMLTSVSLRTSSLPAINASRRICSDGYKALTRPGT